jgi:hypothetical protein
MGRAVGSWTAVRWGRPSALHAAARLRRPPARYDRETAGILARTAPAIPVLVLAVLAILVVLAERRVVSGLTGSVKG